jgi:uncharacterized protein
LRTWLRHHLSRRPHWMNALMLFSAYMAFVYVPWDLFVKPVAVDEEVWFGVIFHGWWAKVLAVPHWIVYALGTYGFWRMRPWMWPWASVYAAQVAISMVVWPLLYLETAWRLPMALVSGTAFSALAIALWQARPHFRGPRPSLRDRYGEWALVTGASSGIGAAFARALARDGVNLVLVARREERLRAVSDEIEKQHGVAVRTVAADLATREGVRDAVDSVSDLDVAILVNNAGFGYVGRFDQQDATRLEAMVQLHCAAPVALTAALLPKLVERGRGAVLFTGSVSGSQPLPLHALYSATKSFDNFLAEALWGELLGTGVDVLGVLPGSTETEFQEVAEELPHPGETPEQVVETALAALGHQPSVISGWFNWLRANAAVRIPPRSLTVLAAKRVIERWVPKR